jgi:hypothetical protein
MKELIIGYSGSDGLPDFITNNNLSYLVMENNYFFEIILVFKIAYT